MAVLYIKEQGAYVQKSGEKIVVTKNNLKLLELPVIHIDNIAIIGNVQVSTQALHMLMEHGIDVSYMTYSGKYLGRTGAESSKNIFLRFEQYRFYLDELRRLEMARIITDNKIRNQEALISHHRWEGDYDYRKDIERMEELRKELPAKMTSNEILGIEGICSQIYFGGFGRLLKCDFTFDGRNRRPPRDPVNVILSLGYTFLTKEVSAALDAESFEMYLGFLHGIRYGRKSLALDMVEEFRQPVVDRLTVLLFNKRMIGKYDFDFPQDGTVVLNEDGFKKFTVEFERWIDGKNSASGNPSFRKTIRSQVGKLKKCIKEGDVYQPYSWRDGNVCDQL